MPTYAYNRDARFKYSIEETIEAGIQLQGWEVSAVKGGNVSLKGSFVKELGGEMYLINATITPRDEHKTGRVNIDPERSRKLLLHTEEIQKLDLETKRKGLTVVPLRVYSTRGLIKVEIALAKGKKRFEQAITKKHRSQERQVKRELKRSGF